MENQTTKICTKCKQELPWDSFRWRNKTANKKHSQCKECEKAQEKIHYQESAERRAAVRATADWQRENNLKIINDYKSCGCQKCGEKRLYLLDCHHVDPTTKVFDIARLSKAASELTVRKEIVKCIVLCSNCHREFHHFERECAITLEQYLSPEFTNLLEI